MSNFAVSGPMMSSVFDGMLSVTESFPLRPTDTLADGSYSQRVIAHAAKIAYTDFITTVSMMNEPDSPLDEIALNDAFDMVKIGMGLDLEKVKHPVVQSLLQDLTKACITHNVKSESAEEIRARKGTAKVVKFLVYECAALKIGEIQEKPAFILFEFIYRYAVEDARYDHAFHKLVSCFKTPEYIEKMLDKVLDHFNPQRKALPTVNLLDKERTELNPREAEFITELYQKVVDLADPEDDKEAYCRHMNMIITSIISFTPIERFHYILLESLPHVDPLGLIKSPRFVQHAVDAIVRTTDSDSMFLNYFVDVLLTDDLIAQIPEDFYIAFGLLMNAFANHSYKPFEVRKNRLSAASKSKLLEFNREFNKYDALIMRIESYKYIKPIFPDYSEQSLIAMRQGLDELTENYTKLAKNVYPKFFEAMKDVSLLLTELIKSSFTNLTHELSFERFKVFQSFLNFLIKNDTQCTTFRKHFVHITVYFNGIAAAAPIKMNCDDGIVDIARNQLEFILIDKLISFQDTEYRAFFDFLNIIVGHDQAVKEFNTIFAKILKHSSSTVVANVSVVNVIASAVQISPHEAFITHLLAEMMEFVSFSSTKTTSPFLANDDSRLISYYIELNRLKEFSKSEKALFHRFATRFNININYQEDLLF